MFWPPSGCMATTPRFRSSPKAIRRPAGFGCMSAMTGRSAARILRRRCSMPRVIERASILSGIWPATPASCRPTHSMATIASILPSASLVRSSKLCAGATRGASSSSWRISPPMRGAARMRHRSRRSLWRLSNASTRCSPSNARSRACQPPSAWLRAGKGALRWSMHSRTRVKAGQRVSM